MHGQRLVIQMHFKEYTHKIIMVLNCIFITKKGTKYRHHCWFPQNNSTKTVSHHFPFPCSFERHPTERKQEVGDKWREKHGNKVMMRKKKCFVLRCCSSSVIHITIRTVALTSVANERNLM